MDVLISGVGIAGPTLAYWLSRYGCRVTMVEHAPRLRDGGYVIDFWGAGFEVADRMGLLPRLYEKGYLVREVRLVGSNGRRVGGFKVDSITDALKGRFVSLPRGDLAASIFSTVQQRTETLFGDQIVALRPQGARVQASFEHATTKEFDVVVGAGGLHSKVRSLVFGEEDRFTSYLGYKVAAFEVPDYQPRDELVYVSYGRPGIQASRFSLRSGATLILLIMADDNAAMPESVSDQKVYLRGRFGNAGWECPHMLAALDRNNDFYFDRVSQVQLPSWSKDHTVLLGDAAFCPSLLAGEGSSLAMAAAYVLAGELHAAGGDVSKAFHRYEQQLRPLITRKQKAARRFATSFAPKTRLGLLLRNWITNAMAIPWVADLALGAGLRDDFDLPDYN